ncbi:hypothetical protein AY599_20585 [Leptolyngbya valderiana BDU 20041]|nr:hypothetical protein AY599_20585 [Leptolyngbya valderiana BDU 20041]
MLKTGLKALRRDLAHRLFPAGDAARPAFLKTAEIGRMRPCAGSRARTPACDLGSRRRPPRHADRALSAPGR